MNEGSAERPLYGLLLAGGKSRRMGQDKALLLRDGQDSVAQPPLPVGALEHDAAQAYVSGGHFVGHG